MAGDAGVRSIEDLRGFAAYLRNLGGNMVDEFTHARQEMYRVNEGWNDTENQRFMEEFEQSIELIVRIADHMERYSTFVDRKCDILEQYVNTRM